MAAEKKFQPIIGIIGGKGKMGQLFADFFEENGLKVLISDLGTKLTNKEVAEKADIVIVAVTMGRAEAIIKEVEPWVRGNALLADITSIKEGPMKAMAKCQGETLGMHPMFGASNPIPGQLIIYCPIQSGKLTKWLLDLFKKNNVILMKLTAAEHDEVMAYAQGIIHFSEIVFAHTLHKLGKPVRDILKFTGIASDIRVLMAGRVIFQDPQLYGNIQIMNPRNLPLMKQFIRSSEELLKIVKKKNLSKFSNYFDDAKNFWGKYTQEAYQESSWIIDQVLAARRAEKMEQKISAQKRKTVNKNKAVAVLGPEGTYSGLAAAKFIAEGKEELTPIYLDSIDKVFEAVVKGRAKQGIVPVENKINGSVRETLDNLFQHQVKVIGEVVLPIHHCLVGLPHANKSDISKIISHEQALSQCHQYMRKNFPTIKESALASTAAGIHELLITQNKNLAVIAPQEAAEKNNLKIVASNIEDEKGNETHFFVIQKGEFAAADAKKDSAANHVAIAFHFGENMPGTLFSVFEIFAKAKIDLTKIESRPTSKKFGNYIFYLDFQGRFTAAKVQKALKEVAKKVKKLKILGVY